MAKSGRTSLNVAAHDRSKNNCLNDLNGPVFKRLNGAKRLNVLNDLNGPIFYGFERSIAMERLERLELLEPGLRGVPG